MKRDLLSFALWKPEQIREVLELAAQLKAGPSSGDQKLRGRGIALVFDQESLRTRVSFEVGIAQLGGHAVFLQQETIGIATRESVHDIAQVLSEYVSAIVARTTRHHTCVQLADSAPVPVINALTDLLHPCQVLADAFTLQERGRFAPETRIAYLGAGTSVVNSWLELARLFPLTLVLSCPSGYEPHPKLLEEAQAAGISSIRFEPDPERAVEGADVIYTDVWPAASAGLDVGKRIIDFRPYQLNAALLKRASSEVLVMHRLPANRGEEVTSDVLDGPHSIVLAQAANRLHVQKAVLSLLVV